MLIHVYAYRQFEILCMDTSFNLLDVCLYKLDRYNEMIPHRKDDHLGNCENFESDITFKCPAYYYIIWSYVCDGKWDCPNGEEELKNNICITDYKCF